MKNNYKIHPSAEIVPMMIPSALLSLRDDIEANGQKVPIVLWRNQVIDGRCRQDACNLLDIEVLTTSIDWDFPEDKLTDEVRSLNNRRQLTLTQKAFVVVRDAKESDKTQKALAKHWVISTATVIRASWIEKNYQTIADKLFAGEKVKIVNKDGKDVHTDSIKTIQDYLKSIEKKVPKIEFPNFETKINHSTWNAEQKIGYGDLMGVSKEYLSALIIESGYTLDTLIDKTSSIDRPTLSDEHEALIKSMPNNEAKEALRAELTRLYDEQKDLEDEQKELKEKLSESAS